MIKRSFKVVQSRLLHAIWFLLMLSPTVAAEYIDCAVRVRSDFNAMMAMGIVTAELEASYSNVSEESIAFVTLAPLNDDGKRMFVRDFIAMSNDIYQMTGNRKKLNPILPGQTSALRLEGNQEDVVERTANFYSADSTEQEKLDNVERLLEKVEAKYDSVERCEVRGVTTLSTFLSLAQ